LQAFDIGRNMQRFDIDQIVKLCVLFTPGEEPVHGQVIGCTGVLVANGGGEEFQKAPSGIFAVTGNENRHGCPVTFDPDRKWSIRLLSYRNGGTGIAHIPLPCCNGFNVT